MKTAPLLLAISLGLFATTSVSADTCLHYKPQLAIPYEIAKINNWENYLFSEKLDGIRAYWSGEYLFTRQGKLIYAPKWFIDALPQIPLEGELWIGRNRFEETMAAVMDGKPNDKEWDKVKFMVFDLPASLDSFDVRYKQFKSMAQGLNIPHLGYVEHKPVESKASLLALLESVNESGGEGLMLRKRSGIYQPGRSTNVIKMKLVDDAEAEVIGYVKGKGKHEGRMGALVVRMPDGKEFKIGTGFSDAQRENPPELGDMVTYRHNGFTKNGIPKFARFMRVDASKQ
ncbi:DNA ligase [Grimontia sp. NTOU-MAR1]|uniref:DNA ligase n=1 Tax=Grimontia sp. NTOU-MAR1 TaxID=3111011 RepID=UPI002DB80F1A|nr:DNA ligase [Grimontia sp. NTOU-MAR1]WRV98186.1 DNA ligase [Grimontia sp. NTOU-MAR1]